LATFATTKSDRYFSSDAKTKKGTMHPVCRVGHSNHHKLEAYATNPPTPILGSGKTLGGRRMQERRDEFLSLFLENQSSLWVVVIAGGVPSAEAGGVVQQLALLLWENFERFEVGSNFRAWAFAFARNHPVSLPKPPLADAVGAITRILEHGPNRLRTRFQLLALTI
jgi:hypothetical protein